MSKNKVAEADEKFVGDARIDEAYRRLQEGEPFQLKVGSRWSRISPHPLADAPLMPREMFEALISRAREFGFREPVVLTSMNADALVIKGRHRVAACWVLGWKLVSDGSLTGSRRYGSKGGLPYSSTTNGMTAEELRELVFDDTVVRRHLTSAQEALLVVEMLLPDAKAAAKERKGTRTDLSASWRGGAKAAEEVALKCGGLVSARSIERIMVVSKDGTPDTYRRVWNREITSVVAAHKAAKEELAEREEAARKAAEAATKAAEKSAAEDKDEKPLSARTPTPRLVKIGSGIRLAAEALEEDLQHMRGGLRSLLTPDEQRDQLLAVQSLLAEWFSILDNDDLETSPAPPEGEAF